MTDKTRLDVALVDRHVAKSRKAAAQLIAAGAVRINGQAARKPAQTITSSDEITVDEGLVDRYVSRGAHKLVGALAAFGHVLVDQKVCLDAGASTGGFTQVLLDHGAGLVHAIDVGSNQLAAEIASDPKVAAQDHVNVRYLTAGDLTPTPQCVVADLSFISLTVVLPALVAVAAPTADWVLMVKPQFEVGRENLGRTGVVAAPALHHQAVAGVIAGAADNDLVAVAMAPSVLPGPAGNREYFVAFRHADHVGGSLTPCTTGDIATLIGQPTEA